MHHLISVKVTNFQSCRW